MAIAERMRFLMEEGENDLEMKVVLPQLVLAMDAMGLDPQDEEAQDQFIALLKKLASNKNVLKKAMKNFSASKATKAVKAAKAAV